jgi:hypothetical protein
VDGIEDGPERGMADAAGVGSLEAEGVAEASAGDADVTLELLARAFDVEGRAAAGLIVDPAEAPHPTSPMPISTTNTAASQRFSLFMLTLPSDFHFEPRLTETLMDDASENADQLIALRYR